MGKIATRTRFEAEQGTVLLRSFDTYNPDEWISCWDGRSGLTDGPVRSLRGPTEEDIARESGWRVGPHKGAE